MQTLPDLSIYRLIDHVWQLERARREADASAPQLAMASVATLDRRSLPGRVA